MSLSTSFPPELSARFRPLEVLGSGSMGAVFVARDRRLKRKVAIKLIRADVVDDELRERFAREAAALALVTHPNVVKIFDHGQAGPQLYLVMELVEGPSFQALLPADGLVTSWEQLAGAIQACHEQQIIHRDIKLENAVREASGRAVLIDFGLASMPDQTALTGEGLFLGTLPYAAPELLWGANWSPASDQYSWGVGLYRLLEGRFPYSQEQLLGAIQGRGLPPIQFSVLAQADPNRSRLQALLSQDPDDRSEGWLEVPPAVATVRPLLKRPAPRGAPSSPGATPAAPPRRRRSHRRLSAVLSLGVVLALGTMVAVALRARAPAPTLSRPEAVTLAKPTDLAWAQLASDSERLRRLLIAPGMLPGLEIRDASSSQFDSHLEALTDPRLPLSLTRTLRAAEELVATTENDLTSPADVSRFERDLMGPIQKLAVLLTRTQAVMVKTLGKNLQPPHRSLQINELADQLDRRARATAARLKARRLRIPTPLLVVIVGLSPRFGERRARAPEARELLFRTLAMAPESPLFFRAIQGTVRVLEGTLPPPCEPDEMPNKTTLDYLSTLTKITYLTAHSPRGGRYLARLLGVAHSVVVQCGPALRRAGRRDVREIHALCAAAAADPRTGSPRLQRQVDRFREDLGKTALDGTPQAPLSSRRDRVAPRFRDRFEAWLQRGQPGEASPKAEHLDTSNARREASGEAP